MDLRQFWKYNYQSICKIRHLKAGKTIGGGTGFKIDGKIITNSHVYNSSDADEIQINFVDKDCVTPTLTKTYKKEQFEDLLLDAMPPTSWDFAILNASDNDYNFIPSLVLADTDLQINIGQPCFFLGYPLSSKNLSIHSAIVSSKFTLTSTSVKYLQIDASVNNGNSGGPLLDCETGKVIGIITLKKTGFTKRFEELNDSFKKNIEALEVASKHASIQIAGIDTLQSFKIIQTQFDHLSAEISRTANVGIGYAFELDEIRKFTNHNK
ncbi:MAG: serine protease [Flavobacterium sp.]|nr:serine protease [Flavobacterium sp.]MDP3930387.1 serine protease [Bacteroidota bacterium]